MSRGGNRRLDAPRSRTRAAARPEAPRSRSGPLPDLRTLCHLAYRAIRTHWDGPQGTWETDVFAHAWQHNETTIANDFTRGPLPYTEVHHLAQSIARWTWRNMTRDTFHARQRALSKQATKAASEARHEQAEALRQVQRKALI